MAGVASDPWKENRGLGVGEAAMSGEYRECTECRWFVICEWPKVVYHKVTGTPCEEFEEAAEVQQGQKRGTKNDRV